MKTPDQWLNQLSDTECEISCICERCKKGRETFLLAKDIREIQADVGITDFIKDLECYFETVLCSAESTLLMYEKDEQKDKKEQLYSDHDSLKASYRGRINEIELAKNRIERLKKKYLAS